MHIQRNIAASGGLGQSLRMLSEPVDLKGSSPFDLDNDQAYSVWRQWKLERATIEPADLVVSINDPMALSGAELERFHDLVAAHNMVIYRLADKDFSDKSLVHELGKQLGLVRLDNNLRADEDSVTSLEVRPQAGNQYIPYTNKGLSWHTDGYYNSGEEQVRGVILHCVSPSASGGESAMIDHDLVYIRLRDEDPSMISALMHPQAMTIPANIENGVELRPEQPGPVFSVEPNTGSLHMRYSARKRNIAWRDDEQTVRAASRITELLDDESLVVRYRLQAGEGTLGNNVLHNRTAFEDSAAQKRLMYRARYFDRIK